MGFFGESAGLSDNRMFIRHKNLLETDQKGNGRKSGFEVFL
jgi:hypothetical protein